MLAVRGSLRRRSRLSHPAVHGSLRRRSRLSHPAVRGTSRRRSRLSHPAVRGILRRRSRLSHPAVRGTSCRRSRLSHPTVRGSWRRRSRLSDPAVRGNSRRRSRINQPTVHRRWRHHPRLTLAHRPAADSMPAGLPLTQCPPVCLWLNARRIAADSSPPDCRWLKPAGLPLTQARRIAADSSSPDCRWLMPAGRRWQGKPTRSSVHAAVCGSPTPPFAGDHAAGHGESQPTVGGCLYNAGKANPPSAVHSARSRLRLPPARRPLPLSGQASRLLPLLSSQPIMVSPAGRCRIDKPADRGRIWPVSDHGLFNCFCVFSPGGLLIPLSFPKEILGGVVGLRPKRLRWGLGPRSRRRSRHGLPSSLLRHGLPSSLLRHGLPSSLLRHGLPSSLFHLDLGLSVPLWRPRPVYVSVSVLWGLQSAHPPSLVVLLRHGTCLPGGGSYVRGVSCVSCVPASCFHIWFVSCDWVYLVPGVCVIVNYLVYLSLVFWISLCLVYSSFPVFLLVIPGVSTLPCLPLMLSLKTIILKYLLVCVFLVSPWCVHRDTLWPTKVYDSLFCSSQ